MAPRIGLALSGGGSKGAFTVGVLKIIDRLLDPAPYPVISGTSTGSLVGTLLTTNQFHMLVDIYSKVQTENIVNPHHAFVAEIFGPEGVLFASAIIGGRAIYDAKALRRTIEANLDFDRLKRASARTLMIYNTVNLQTGRLVTFNNRDYPRGTVINAILASACMPVITDPVDIRVGMRREQYVDGGVREFLPLRAIFDSGVRLDHIIAISTAPLSPQRKPRRLDKITEILVRTVDLLDCEVGRDDYSGALQFNAILRLIENAEAEGIPRSRILDGVPAELRRRIHGKRSVPVTFIGPDRHIDMNSMEFDPAKMRELMRAGVRVGRRVVPSIARMLP